MGRNGGRSTKNLRISSGLPVLVATGGPPVALELRQAGIRVNSILPGFADTELVSANRDNYNAGLGIDFDTLINQAQGGYVTVDDVASLALFLAGERSQFCNGGAYVVDGGLTASLF